MGTVSEGQVLDVRVLSTSGSGRAVARRRIHRALHSVTGAADVPDRAGAWAEWLRAREAEERERKDVQKERD